LPQGLPHGPLPQTAFLTTSGFKTTGLVYFIFHTFSPIIYSNNIMVSKQIIFRTIAHQDDVSTIWGIDRQDLLAALVKERFQWSNILGTQLIKTYDSGKVAENGYYYRNMYFEQTAPNDIQNRLKSNRLDKLGRDYYG